ncbi:helix-turn-helix domain-containing protein [Polaribacter sp.]|uniref:helix-turn-helix domain-containing protein n=1 Tax=Polaribacter sp. TaxID=1920175 RepID=UPI003F69C011
MNISPDSLIALVLSSFGILFCMVIGIQILFRKNGIKQTNILLGLLLVLYGITLINGLLAMTGVYSSYQNLYFLPLVFTLSIGPLFYFFVRSRMDSGFRLKVKHSPHLILPGMQFLFYCYTGFQSVERKSEIWRGLIEPYVQYIEEVLVIGSALGYLIYSIYLLNNTIPKSKLNSSVLNWLKRFAKALLVLLLISSIYEVADWILWNYFEFNLFNTPWLDFPLKISYALFSLLIGYNAYIYQNQSLIIKPGFHQSYSSEIAKNIEVLFNEEKIYMDPELNLEGLAKLLNTSKNNISKHFSEQGHSFRGIINTYRIRHFKSLIELGEHKNMSLLGLALVSGFNSKASFNRIFKEQLGKTPSAYIKEHS